MKCPWDPQRLFVRLLMPEKAGEVGEDLKNATDLEHFLQNHQT
jgi:hypothetical protein